MPSLKNRKSGRPVIGITAGDPAGIGPEICIKALENQDVYRDMIPVVYCDRVVLEDAIRLTGLKHTLNKLNVPSDARGKFGTIDFIDVSVISRLDEFSYGRAGVRSGDAAFKYVENAVSDALAGRIAAVVTCPVNKEAINLAGHNFAGHTEIFAHYTNTKDYGMLLSARVNDRSLNVIHVTTHVSLAKACGLITRERVYRAVCLAGKALSMMGIKGGRIAVAGLNPHSSENGLFGNEEKDSILPAVLEAKEKGFDVTGPLPPDTVFARALAGQFDIVVAMYHDQGHIPLKLLGFMLNASTGSRAEVRGINATIGLPVIRTSVDHGTAFDIAGKNLAGEGSLLDALDMAVRFIENFYHEPH